MTTNALVFKSTVYPEWYVPSPHLTPSCANLNPHRFTDRLAPWVHYVPIQVNYSDLYDALVFFRGDLAGRGAHEKLAAKIAREGREWSLNFWREEDMVAYLFRYVRAFYWGMAFVRGWTWTLLISIHIQSRLITVYFRLFLEYARVMSEDRDTLNFELEDV